MNNNISNILQSAKEVGFVVITKDSKKEESQSIKEAVAFGLLEEYRPFTYRLTEKGYKSL